MISHSLYYSADKAYKTILNRIPSYGYSIIDRDANKKMMSVWKWYFPFIKRSFLVSVIPFSDTICSFSIIEKSNLRISDKYEKELMGIVSIFF
jgi:hypothetical protein